MNYGNRTKTPESIRISQCATMSAREMTADPGRAMSMAKQTLREHVTELVLSKAVKQVDVGTNVVHYRMDLYVATPDEFWEIVNAEAERLVMSLRIR